MDNKEMIMLRETENFDSHITESMLAELQIYSTFKVENKAKGAHVIQRFYVPKAEHEFYKSWKEKVTRELSWDNQNAVLIRNIARRHRLRVEK